MKAVILRPFHREWAKCDGTHSVAAIMFCGSTLCHHQPHLHLQDWTKWNSIKVLKPNIDFEALMELGRYDSFHVHLLQCLQDEECDKLDQIWREVGQLLRKPIGLEQEDTIWWR